MTPQPPGAPAEPRPEPAASTEPASRVSRRSVLRGAGAAGLVAAGATTVLTGTAGTSNAAATRPDGQAGSGAAGSGAAGSDAAGSGAAGSDGPVMVYLANAATGEMDVFAGTSQVRLRDPALASQLLRAIK